MIPAVDSQLRFLQSYQYSLYSVYNGEMTYYSLSCDTTPWIILGICSANESRRYIVTSFFIGWAHIPNSPLLDVNNNLQLHLNFLCWNWMSHPEWSLKLIHNLDSLRCAYVTMCWQICGCALCQSVLEVCVLLPWLGLCIFMYHIMSICAMVCVLLPWLGLCIFMYFVSIGAMVCVLLPWSGLCIFMYYIMSICAMVCVLLPWLELPSVMYFVSVCACAHWSGLCFFVLGVNLCLWQSVPVFCCFEQDILCMCKICHLARED